MVATDAKVKAMREWVLHHVVMPLAKRYIAVRFSIMQFKNTLHKPGPAMNFAMEAAFEDGADFFCRINDDTEFLDKFTTPSIARLRKFSPPFLGVVGAGPNNETLTHDFVHRTHLEIFKTYYPPKLTDWWLDNWITEVYGRIWLYIRGT